MLVVGDGGVNAEGGRGMVFNRVEHVDHVEDLEMGFHPIPQKRTNHL